MKHHVVTQTFFLLLLLFPIQPVTAMPKAKTITRMEKQLPPRPYLCDFCDKNFSYKHSLTTHKKIHTRIDSHQCDVCFKIFTAKSILIRHEKTHIRKKLYECEKCDKIFSHESTLVAHQKTKHTEQQTYPCNICDYQCTSNHLLTVHKRGHTNKKPLDCKLCYKSFYYAGSLTRHVIQYHSQHNSLMTIIVPKEKPLLTNITEQKKPLYEFNAAATDPNLLEWIDKL